MNDNEAKKIGEGVAAGALLLGLPFIMVGALLLPCVASLYNGFVLSKLWAWHVITGFNAPVVPWWAFAAVLLGRKLLLPLRKDESGFSFWLVVAWPYLAGSVILLAGWILTFLR